MTSQDIIRIALHVAALQGVADLVSLKLVFEKDSYRRACANVERMKIKRDKAVVSSAGTGKADTNTKSGMKASERSIKRLQRAEDDYSDAVAEVSKKHALPSMATSLFFFILYRVMQTEYSGRVVAILPFVPFPLAQNLTRRGLPKLSAMQYVDGVDPARACGFFFVYMLSTFSVKFLVSKFVAVKAPEGCEGITSMLESPRAQKIMEKLGVDPEEVLNAKDTAKQALG
jgi:hypothetical protein